MKNLPYAAVCLVMLQVSVFSLSSIALSKNYNLEWSIEMDKYSAITHCNESQIKTWSCRLCNQAEKPVNITYLYNEKSSILAFMGYLPLKKVIIISWRGTVDAANWIEDFSYYQIDYPYCKSCRVHFGFLTSYLSVEPELTNNLKKLHELYPYTKIISVGSSLGAALATICALDLQLKTGLIQELHAFGSPRVGNQEYARYLTTKIPNIFRVVHNRDIVPHVPLQEQNYHHIPNEILFDENMENYVICDDSGEDPNCSNKYQPNYSIPDHITYFYKPDLEDLCTL